MQNVLKQTDSITFDDTQDRLPTSSTDVTGQTTSVRYSIDSIGNQTLQDKDPGETGSYTSQSTTYSTCDFGSNLPCYEIDGVSSQYPNARLPHKTDYVGALLQRYQTGAFSMGERCKYCTKEFTVLDL